MLWEAFTGGADEEEDSDGIPLRQLLLLAIATSIDALAVGISFAFLDVAIVPAALAIGSRQPSSRPSVRSSATRRAAGSASPPRSWAGSSSSPSA